MSKRNTFLIIILICVLFIIFIFRFKINNQILIWIDKRLDYERMIDVGDEFNKVAWGDLSVQINHYKSGNKLEYVKNNKKVLLLEAVINYKISENKLYVIAKDGCAVVDGNNMVKICTTSKYKYTIDNVIYLTSFDDFEENEQRVLNKLK